MEFIIRGASKVRVNFLKIQRATKLDGGRQRFMHGLSSHKIHSKERKCASAKKIAQRAGKCNAGADKIMPEHNFP